MGTGRAFITDLPAKCDPGNRAEQMACSVPMRIVLRYSRFLFFSWSDSGNLGEPVPIHVRKGGGEAKFQVVPDAGVAARVGLKTFAFDAELYKVRNLVERFFNKLKHFRAVATRHDKRDDNCLASVQLASIRIWLRSYESVT